VPEAGPQPSRRAFVAGGAALAGALVVGFRLDGAAAAPGEAVELDAWIVVRADGAVIVRYAKAEMGQGVSTALAMLVAEELRCDWRSVSVEPAETARQLRDGSYGRMGTGGSSSVRGSREALLEAGRQARARLLGAAARRFAVPPAECEAEAGRVLHRASGRSFGFGELAAEAAALGRVPQVRPISPADYRLIGRPTGRLDALEKVTGRPLYGIDVRLPDMLYAAVRHAPRFGAEPAGHDFAAIVGLPGVAAAVSLAGGVAVVADSTWRARKAADALPVEWKGGGDLSSESLEADFRKALGQEGQTAVDRGDALARLQTAAHRLDAVYAVPYLAHACMEPVNCTAQVRPDRVDVWVGTQNPEGAARIAARVAGVEAKAVHVHRLQLGGGFGRRFYGDEVREAVTVARAVAPRPVKLTWSREEDMRRDFYRPMSLVAVRGGLDGGGRPVALLARAACQSVFKGAGFGSGGLDRPAVEGLGDQAYRIPDVRVEWVEREAPVPVAFWRSVGHSQNAFVLEGFVDEMAAAAGADPLAFRKAMLADRPDWTRLLEAVAARIGWGEALPKGRGRGLAIHESFGSVVAEAAEVSVDPGGRLKVERVVVAIDCGGVVNPLTVEAQMQGSVAYALSAALYGGITVRDGGVQESNFHDQPILAPGEMPQVETLLLPSGRAWGGVGEPAVPPLAPAVVNAVFRATGRRIRRLPLAHQDLTPA